MRASSAYTGRYRAILDGYPITPAVLAAECIVLAEQAGALLGFYALVVTGEPELDLMFVADAAQGTGAGRALFDHMRETARAQGIASVKIVSHPPSLGFYERMGAVRTGTSSATARVSWERPILHLTIAVR